jgi:hypothetical protein
MKHILDFPERPSFWYIIWRFCLSLTAMSGLIAVFVLAWVIIESALTIASGLVRLGLIFASFIAITGATIEAMQPVKNNVREKFAYVAFMLSAAAANTISAYAFLYEDNQLVGP